MYRGKPELSFLAGNSPIDFLLPVFPAIAVQAAKQTITLPIPVQWCYQWLSILFKAVGGNFIPDMITEYRLKVNGNLLQQMSGLFRDAINVYYGWPTGVAPAGVATDYCLMIPFQRLNMRGAAFYASATGKPGNPLDFGCFSIEDTEMETCLNCGIQDPVTGSAITQVILEIDLINTNGAGIASIAAVNKAKVYPQDPNGPGYLMFENHMTFNSAVGTDSIIQGNGLLYGDMNHSFWDSEFIFPPATQTMDNFQVWLNSQEIFQRTAEENAFFASLYGVRFPIAPAAGTLQVIDFCETGFADGVKFIQPASTSAKIQYDAGVAGGNVDLIQRSLGILG